MQQPPQLEKEQHQTKNKLPPIPKISNQISQPAISPLTNQSIKKQASSEQFHYPTQNSKLSLAGMSSFQSMESMESSESFISQIPSQNLLPTQTFPVVYNDVAFMVDPIALAKSSSKFQKLIDPFIEENPNLTGMQLDVRGKNFSFRSMNNFLRTCQTLPTDVENSEMKEICEIAKMFQAEKIYKIGLDFIQKYMDPEFNVPDNKYDGSDGITYMIVQCENHVIHHADLDDLDFEDFADTDEGMNEPKEKSQNVNQNGEKENINQNVKQETVNQNTRNVNANQKVIQNVKQENVNQNARNVNANQNVIQNVKQENVNQNARNVNANQNVIQNVKQEKVNQSDDQNATQNTENVNTNQNIIQNVKQEKINPFDSQNTENIKTNQNVVQNVKQENVNPNVISNTVNVNANQYSVQNVKQANVNQSVNQNVIQNTENVNTNQNIKQANVNPYDTQNTENVVQNFVDRNVNPNFGQENLNPNVIQTAKKENITPEKIKSVIYHLRIESHKFRSPIYHFCDTDDSVLYTAKQKDNNVLIGEGNDVQINGEASNIVAHIYQDNEKVNFVRFNEHQFKIKYSDSGKPDVLSLEVTFPYKDRKITWVPKTPKYNPIKDKYYLNFHGEYHHSPIKSRKNIVLQNQVGQTTFIVRKMENNLFEVECLPVIDPLIVFTISLSDIVGPFNGQLTDL